VRLSYVELGRVEEAELMKLPPITLGVLYALRRLEMKLSEKPTNIGNQQPCIYT